MKITAAVAENAKSVLLFAFFAPFAVSIEWRYLSKIAHKCTNEKALPNSMLGSAFV